MMTIRNVGLFAAALALASVYGCSSDSTTTPPAPAVDSGTSGGNTYKLTGRMIGYTSKSGAAGWDVTAAGVKSTTDSKGNYSLDIPKDATFNLTVTDPANGHFTLFDQEAKLTGDYDYGELRFVETTTGEQLLTVLGADKTKGVVSVALIALPSCETKATDFPQGAKVSVDGQADAKVVYYKGIPSADLTEAQGGEDPSAVVFNATADAALNVKVDYTKCTQKAYPVAVDQLTYTGKIQPKGNSVLSVYRIYFE